jgi:hypothetical protein
VGSIPNYPLTLNNLIWQQLQNSRQSRALVMLENQLKSKVKTQKKTTDVKIPLTDSDIKE